MLDFLNCFAAWRLAKIFGRAVNFLVVLCTATLISAGSAALSAAESPPVTVISALDVNDLPPGRHHFHFEAGWYNTGQPVQIPVVVIKGEKPGKRFLVTAAVHGDELNGIGVIHRLLEDVSPDRIAGTIVAVPGLNQPGLRVNNRRFFSAAGGGYYVDLNRNFPGSNKPTASSSDRYLGAIWANLLKPNADFAVDIHTQTRGTAYPLFVFADFENRDAKKAAYLLGADIVKNDQGQKGTLETTLMEAGVPAVTLEVGAPKVFQADLIARAVTGIKNLMRYHDMLAGEPVSPEVTPIVGTKYTNVYTETGGIAVVHVKLTDKVKKGQRVASLYDPFGQKIKDYMAPHDGWILAVATDPMRETGSMLVRVLR